MVKESLMVYVQKLLLKKYMKNNNIYIYIYIYINKVEEKKIIEEKLIPLLGFKKYILAFALLL